MIIHKPKQKAGTSFSQLSQKRDDGFTNWPGDKGNCFFSLQEDPTIAQALGVVEMWSVLSILNAIYRMIRNANSSVIWLSSYKCQWQPVCCIGNSSNRLTTAQFHGSGGGRQTAALSAVISKGAKRPFQRQLGVGVLKGEGDATPGGRQAQSRSATRCQHVCLLHGDCKPNTVQGGKKYHRRARKMSILPRAQATAPGYRGPQTQSWVFTMSACYAPRCHAWKLLEGSERISLSVHTTLVSDRPLKADSLTKPVSEMKLIPFKSCVWCGGGEGV